MPGFSSPAILLRRIEHGDYDLIITLLTLDKGKTSVIAKSAKKSRRRFAGVLELFSILDVVCSHGRGRGLPVLQEAAIKHPLSAIHGNIKKTAYASYWAELINAWTEEGKKQASLFRLLKYALLQLDNGPLPEAAVSIFFQIRFMEMSGLIPDFVRCIQCGKPIDQIREVNFYFYPAKGGGVCQGCHVGSQGGICISKGTLKQLQWIEKADLEKAGRIRFSTRALKEGTELLETFVPYHFGKEPRSLKFLQQIRSR